MKMDTRTLFTDVCKKKEYIVSNAINYSCFFKLVNILDIANSDIVMGISEDGLWTIKRNNKIIILNSKKSFKYTVVLLETQKKIIDSMLEDYFNLIGIKVNINDVFPFSDIVNAGFEFGTEYWAKLAFDWFEKFDFSIKINSKENLLRIVNEKIFDQKLRHKIINELAKMNC
jgi:hypothetical protein